MPLVPSSLKPQASPLCKQRHEAGLAPKLDVVQARSNYYTTQSVIPSLRISLEKAENRLCVLSGRPPYELSSDLGESGSIPVAAGEIVLGVPAELLRRRPDIRSAERKVASEIARIGVATAELYPQFSLTGTITVDSTDIARLFDMQSMVHKVGPSFRWNILNYGRINGNILAQDAKFQELVAVYEQTVLKANTETENAIVGFLKSQEYP